MNERPEELKELEQASEVLLVSERQWKPWIWCFFKGGHDFQDTLWCADCGQYRWHNWSLWPWSMMPRRQRQARSSGG